MHRFERHDYSMFQQPEDLASEWPFTCIDWERAGLEFVTGGDVWAADAPLGVYVFRSC